MMVLHTTTSFDKAPGPSSNGHLHAPVRPHHRALRELFHKLASLWLNCTFAAALAAAQIIDAMAGAADAAHAAAVAVDAAAGASAHFVDSADSAAVSCAAACSAAFAVVAVVVAAAKDRATVCLRLTSMLSSYARC